MLTASPQSTTSPRAVGVTPTGLRLADGTCRPLISGAVHYWRLARGDWSPILDSVVAMGFTLIETYVPWSVHEIERGRYDLGQGDPAKDLGAFLTLCENKHLQVLIRPGPNIIAELTGFGFPARILHDPDIQARTRTGAAALYDFLIQPAPIPSYASDKLYAEFEPYLDAVFQVVRPHLYPRGCVLGFQADNELGYFFRPAMFDVDYSVASIALYRRFLAERYGDIAELNRLYHRAYGTFDDVCAPTEFRAEGSVDMPYYLDWARYKEYYLLSGLHRVTELLRARGAEDLIVFHNYPGLVGNWPTTPYNSPFHLAQAETTLDLCGVDSYPTKEQYAPLKSQIQHTAATSRLPFIAEFGSGVWPWVRPALPDDEEFTTLTLLMHGIKAINFYMLVERDRWLGSPILRDNRHRPAYFDLLRRVNRFIQASGVLELNKVTPIVLLADRDHERLAGVSALFTPPSRQFLAFMQPEIYLSEDRWDYGHAIALESYQWGRDCNSALTGAGYTFDLADTELPLERLTHYPAAVLPTFDFMSRATQAKLIAYLRAGGLLFYGPQIPTHDENMQPCSLLGDYLAATLFAGVQAHLLADPAALLPVLSRDTLEPQVRVDDPRVEVTVHTSGTRRLLYVANPTAQARTVVLTPGGQFHDLWSGETVAAHALVLAPYTLRVLEAVAHV